jgi:hypothetical protein
VAGVLSDSGSTDSLLSVVRAEPVAPPTLVATARLVFADLLRSETAVDVAALCVAPVVKADAEPDALTSPPTAYMAARAVLNPAEPAPK